MPDEITKIADALIPAIWLPYMIKKSVALSALIRSGIMEMDQEFVNLVDAEKGELVNMPYWEDLTGNSQVLSDGTPLVTKKISSGQDLACIQHRGDGWAVNDLVKYLAGSDPADAIAQLIAEYWVRDQQVMLVALLKGVFSSASMADNILDVAHTTGGAGSAGAANKFNATTFIDAKQKLGDHKQKLTAVAMHSMVEASLEKQGLIDTIQDKDNGEFVKVYQGLRVIVDDDMPQEELDGDVAYTSYLFGRGAIGLGIGQKDHVPEGAAPGSTWQLEWARDAASHVSKLFNRRRFIMHPRGVKWTNVAKVLKTGPTNAEMENGNNWELVFDQKDIRIVQFVHNI